MSSAREVHVERLLGYRVRDADGRVLGRLEDFGVEIIDGETVVTEFHIGSAAFVGRITGFVSQLPIIDRLPFHLEEYRVPWQHVDLSDPRHPRVRVPRSALERVPRDAPE
jgi:sporulation protein YlmC with PRC-barrel domain